MVRISPGVATILLSAVTLKDCVAAFFNPPTVVTVSLLLQPSNNITATTVARQPKNLPLRRDDASVGKAPNVTETVDIFDWAVLVWSINQSLLILYLSRYVGSRHIHLRTLRKNNMSRYYGCLDFTENGVINQFNCRFSFFCK